MFMMWSARKVLAFRFFMPVGYLKPFVGTSKCPGAQSDVYFLPTSNYPKNNECDVTVAQRSSLLGDLPLPEPLITLSIHHFKIRGANLQDQELDPSF
jgi:hypothetical protein